VFSYLAWRWFKSITHRPLNVVGLVLLTSGAVFCGISCLLMFSSNFIKTHRESKIVRGANAVPGRVVSKRSRYWKWIDSSTCYLDFEYDHPGLGRRTATMKIEEDEWEKVDDGAAVTVLCYPHRKRPTLLYEHSLFESVPEPGAPRVKQPLRRYRQPRAPRNKPPRSYAFPSELLKPPPRLTRRRRGTLGCGMILGRLILVPLTLWYLSLVVIAALDARAKYHGHLPNASRHKMLDPVFLDYPPLIAVLLAGNSLCYIPPWFEKRLCRRGTAVTGYVTEKRISRGKHTTYHLCYEYQHPRLGKSRSSVSVPYSRWQTARTGAMVTVLCYPRRAENFSILYEYGDFECR